MDSQKFIGGAGIVASHAASLGASVDFISVTGEDEIRNYALETLSKNSVNAKLLVDESRPTTLKQRYRSKNKSLLRVSHLYQGAISIAHQNKMLELIKQGINDTNLLVFSDFNYGCLPQSLVNNIMNITKNHKLFVAADSQSSSQVGDISRFKNMDLLTPTEREARISTRNHEDGLVVLAERLRQDSMAKNILLKLGEEGLLVYTREDKNDRSTDRITNLNNAVKDEAGAGDSLLITSAMAMACGADIWEAACLGSLAAALQVGRIGNTPLSLDEFLQVLN
jgi:rfaE bifunctional protein kinase chain/domain